MNTLLQDLRHGARMLRSKPGFTVMAVLTLALGIGANTAIFSAVNAVLLRPLPFNDSERIVTLWENNIKDGIERDDVSPANFLDWSERNASFEEIAFANPWSFDFTGNGEPEALRATRVTQNFFQILGARALRGRVFLPEEYEAGRHRVVVLSYGLWQRRFGGDTEVIGQTLLLNNEPYTVVGVLPSEFKLNLFDDGKELWAPQPPDESMRQQRRSTYLKVIGRLKDGVSVEQSRAEMGNIAARLAEEYPQTNTGVGVTVVPLDEQMAGKARGALLLLLGATGFVLLIACANMANLLLARGSAREREFAVRAAIGASRRRLMRQVLTESLMPAVLGCAVGAWLALWGIDLIRALSPDNVPRMDEIGLDRATLLFMLCSTFVTALIFGLAPALQFSKPDLHSSMKESGRRGPARHRLRNTLVIAEVALSLVLLAGAGLLLRSFGKVVQTEPGFASDRLVALQVFIGNRYQRPEQRLAYFNDVIERINTLPGVNSTGIVSAFPLLPNSINPTFPFIIEGKPTPQAGQEPTVYTTVANQAYFETMGIALKQGRQFTQFDDSKAPRVALINEEMARRYFPDEDPLGKKVTMKYRRAAVTLEIIGVVGNVRHEGLDKEPYPEIFQPYLQSPLFGMAIVVRTNMDAATMIPSLKARIWEVNQDQPVYSISTMDKLISDSLASRRFSLVLLGAFAGLALILAAVGIYGVMSFITTERTHEIGIRVALGAQTSDVLKLVIGQGIRLALIGVVVGLAVAIALTRVMTSLLYGVSATDPLTLICVSALLVAVAFWACYAPARRAAKVDPMIALRHE